MQKSKLYFIVSIACFFGFIWIYIFRYAFNPYDIEVCIFKNVTSVSCPACGSSRSVSNLLYGNFLTAFLINPLGYIILSIMIIAPLLMVYDIIANKSYLYWVYYKTEEVLRNKKVSIPLTILVLANWIWNIIKDN